MILPVGPLSDLIRDPAALLHIVVQGTNIQQLTAGINSRLQAPPNVNGAPGKFLDVQLAGGGAGATFIGILTFIDPALPFGFPSDEIGAYPIDGSNTHDVSAQLTLDVAASAPQEQRVVGYALAGGGNGAHYYGVMLTAFSPGEEGTWVPLIQQRQDSLVAGVLVIADLALTADSIVQVQNMGHAGTAGTIYEAVVTAPGNPGTLTITAIDAAGATVNTDTSLLGVTVLTTVL